MKLLFSADWHIKLGTKNIPDTWAINRYNTLFEQLHELESTCDMHIIGGDIFDRLPNMGELELYFKYVSGCKCKTVIFPGNHEALKKNTTFLTNLKEVTNKINPLVNIVDSCITHYQDNTPVFDIIPYNLLKTFEKEPIVSNTKILFTHVRGEIPPHVKPEVDLNLFSRWQLVLAGDLHSHSNSQLNIVYPGSPVTTSFHRNEVDTGVIILDTDTLKWDWLKLEVPQLIRKTINVGEDMPAGDYHHVIYEVEGDMSDLHLVEESDLIDKKISKRDNDVALMLNKEMTMQEELSEYLQYILQIPEDRIEKVMKEFNDNVTRITVG
jgi:DNA repair exonuclease SbcCD nuclease subunit